jgi:hypothetical protein
MSNNTASLIAAPNKITTFHPSVTINRLSTTLNRFNSGSNSSSNLNMCSLGSEPKMDGDAPVALLLVPISADTKDGGS